MCLFFPQEAAISKSDRLCVEDVKQGLYSSIINTSQSILRKRRPHIGGLEDVDLGHSETGFSINQEKAMYIQVMNTFGWPGKHWITFRNWGGKILVYDSCAHGRGEKYDQEVTWAMFNAIRPKDHALYKMACSQQEPSSSHCGVFAIATAVSLAYGENPSKIKFKDSTTLRQHLLSCLERGYLIPFPSQPWDYENELLDREEVCVCMKCEMPEIPSKILNKCDSCGHFYHAVCLGNMNMATVSTRKVIYMYCTDCANSLNNFPQ